jgi:hypothetical protein
MRNEKIIELIDANGFGSTVSSAEYIKIEMLVRAVIGECINALEVDPKMSGTNELACSGTSQAVIKRHFGLRSGNYYE